MRPSKINWYDLRNGHVGTVARDSASRSVSFYVIEGADVRSYLMNDHDGSPLSVVAIHDRNGRASLVYEFTEE